MVEPNPRAILDRIGPLVARYEELNLLLADPQVVSDPDQLRTYAREQAELEALVSAYRRFQELEAEAESAREMLAESQEEEELRQFLREELERLEGETEELLNRIRELLLPADPRDQRNVIVEIRAGTGGEEAALFASDLFRMYARFAERRGLAVEVLSTHPTGKGGLKEIIFLLKGRGAYSQLKYERGVHRVQRVPATESAGRIHTSTATVAVLPEPEEVEAEIRPEDIRVEVFRASGHGGQSVNTTDSAVRLTHLPTGMVVSCQDERSQLQNRMRAMRILRARLYELEEERRLRERGEDRRAQVGGGERAEKIRTYNFPQSRITDHRINYTTHRLEVILDGELDELLEALAAHEQAERLKSLVQA